MPGLFSDTVRRTFVFFRMSSPKCRCNPDFCHNVRNLSPMFRKSRPERVPDTAKEARKAIPKPVVEHKGRGLALRFSGCLPLQGLRLARGRDRLKWGSVEPRTKPPRHVGGFAASGRHRTDIGRSCPRSVAVQPFLKRVHGTTQPTADGRSDKSD